MTNLVSLAAEINREHQLAEQVVRDAIQHAIRTGELLLEAKSSLGHGEWLPWIDQALTISPRQVQRYMRAARNKDEILKCDPGSHLSLKAAMKELAATKPKQSKPKPKAVAKAAAKAAETPSEEASDDEIERSLAAMNELVAPKWRDGLDDFGRHFFNEMAADITKVLDASTKAQSKRSITAFVRLLDHLRKQYECDIKDGLPKAIKEERNVLDKRRAELDKKEKDLQELEYRGKGRTREAFTDKEVKLIRSCLHPDRAPEGMESRYHTAFTAFDEKVLK